MGKDMSKSEVTSEMNIMIKAKNDEFMYIRGLFIEKMLKILMSEDDEVQQHIAERTVA